ncbi:MAG: tRNA (N6-isopentenyl adenosine(37)-C2)-methylthiotransferase MiaB [Acidobacteriota bacterium]|nr:tRNA (N6-isopentenyl adenosine(37)-C2)-methylthiotransferase MiaB [Blastocatellia bacterium]MDW8411920.1 tRNA (N6-isopentenyl adenosine(37)-C2)-methylthiotransferase MiaB [Acidobacteriota bacterium]
MLYQLNRRRTTVTGKKFYIETYGCQMNVHDSEKAAAVLLGMGYGQVAKPEEADLVLLNTCMVREKPEKKVYSRVGELKRGRRGEKKNDKKEQIIGVMGCVAQSEAQKIFRRAPEVKLVVGTHSIGKLPQLIAELEAGFERAIDVRQTKEPDFLEISPAEHQTPYVAYVTIIEGCDNFCSFCIVPFTRGRERSRPALRILQEVIGLRERGYQEVQLLGQNVNSYRGSFDGVDLSLHSGTEEPFVRLLELLAQRSGMKRIKYTTSHPRDFNARIVEVMDEYENLCPWVHLPAQSGSTRILRLMRRDYSRQEYLERIEAIKKAKRDISITGDMIVGYPGETEADFEETLSLVREVEYDGLYMFKYSPRPNTHAAKRKDSVPEQVKTERLLRLQQVQAEVQRRRYERYIGREVEVLVEGHSARGQGQMTGHTACNKVVNFAASESVVGKLVRVRITSTTQNSLLGELLEG